MLDKFRGIKPTHLWHHTSLKAFRAAIKDRYEARKNMDARFYNPKQNLAFAGFVWTSALALLYSMGVFNPAGILKNLQPHDCTPPSGKVCKGQPKLPPCPPPKKKEC